MVTVSGGSANDSTWRRRRTKVTFAPPLLLNVTINFRQAKTAQTNLVVGFNETYILLEFVKYPSNLSIKLSRSARSLKLSSCSFIKPFIDLEARTKETKNEH